MNFLPSLSLDSLLHDARFALRALLREPASSAATILVLALALGLNLTTFRVMDATLFDGYRLVRDNERAKSPSRCSIRKRRRRPVAWVRRWLRARVFGWRAA